LPYVPPDVWEQVQATGRTSADVRVRLWGTKPNVHYRVTLAPRDTRIHVAAIDLDADRTSGQVVVEDGPVTLRGVRGATADGTVETEGERDFAQPATKLRFRVNVAGLTLRKRPARWGLPSQIEGKLTAKANLTLRVRDGKTDTRGSTGQGSITQAKLLG